MKKICFILAIISMFILAGCAQQSAEIIEKEPIAVPTGADEVTETASKVMTQEIKDILGRADKKVKSFSYYHSEPPENTEANKFFVKGTKMKIALFEMKNYDKRVYFDTVYLDTTTKSAVAYCENANDVRCPDKNREFDVDYNDFFKKTAYMWVKEIAYAEKIGEEQIDQRDVDLLQYEKDGKTVKVWINTFYGIAQKVEITKGKNVKIYLFTDLDVNKLDDEDMVR